MIDRVESASYDPEPMTPPTHPETEKLIDEVVREAWVEVPPDYENAQQIVNGKWYSPKFGCDSLEMTVESSFASGRAQGSREENERIKKGIDEVITGEEGRIMLVVKIMRVIEAPKGEI